MSTNKTVLKNLVGKTLKDVLVLGGLQNDELVLQFEGGEEIVIQPIDQHTLKVVPSHGRLDTVNNFRKSYVGKLYQHTSKAVRHGNPVERVFAVCDVEVGRGKPFLIAWKCERRNGLLLHPAYPDLLQDSDPRLFVTEGKNGSTPTASFRLDSYYEPYRR